MSTVNLISEQIALMLGVGHENAMPRHELATRCGTSDRAMRKLIEQARADGFLICNTQDGEGYFIGETDAELMAQYKTDHARAVSTLYRLKPIRQELKKRGVL